MVLSHFCPNLRDPAKPRRGCHEGLGTPYRKQRRCAFKKRYLVQCPAHDEETTKRPGPPQVPVRKYGETSNAQSPIQVRPQLWWRDFISQDSMVELSNEFYLGAWGALRLVPV